MMQAPLTSKRPVANLACAERAWWGAGRVTVSADDRGRARASRQTAVRLQATAEARASVAPDGGAAAGYC